MSVTAPEGFLAGGVAAGIKESGALDLALVVAADGPVAAAATFTTNRAAAAPVIVSRTHLLATGGRAAAVVVNSGCANAATGEAGLAAAERTCALVATALDVSADAVLVCSTGLIGPRLAIERIEDAVPGLAEGLGPDVADGLLAAEAIMTTDTHPKEVVVDGGGFLVGGMAKGAGMIGPNMATLLAVLTTDAAIEPAELAAALRAAVAASFNELIVDGCTSTNDTVVVLASGRRGPVSIEAFSEALGRACGELAEQLARDAEGTTRVATVIVNGAESDADARLAARRVASSLLVKTSLFGADPYWGRVLSELGASEAALSPELVQIAYGDVVVCRGGVEAVHDRDATVRALSQPRVEIICELGLGSGSATVLTTDLGHGYIDENMRTS